MKRLLLSILCLLLFSAPSWCGDDEVMAKMQEYLLAIDRLPADAACAEVDFMIGAVPDSLLRNKVAVAAYRHFMDSKVMGSENVAVHIYDEWFATFKTVFDEIEDLDAAEFYAFVNRRSLIGAPAEHLTLTDARGHELSIPRKGRRTILYFYSAECPKCLYISHKITELLNGGRYKVDFISVYTGDDDQVWDAYIRRNLAVRKTCRTRVFHLKGGEADYVIPYAVVQTPRLFLIDSEGQIIGRQLDENALCQLL